MQILTPSGYKHPSTLSNGDEVCAFDENNTGQAIVNTIENIDFVDYKEWCRWWMMEDMVPSFDWYRINGDTMLFREQSVWRNGINVCHARDLVVGDVIYDDNDDELVIASIETVTDESLLWYRFDISGDHSYIVDSLTVHNASRFWVLGTGTWNAATTTNWSASSGGAGGQSVPGSADTVTFNASSVVLNTTALITLNFGGTITIQSLDMTLFSRNTSGTATWDNSVNNNNMTFSASGAFNNSGSGTRVVKLGSATYNMTANNPTWQFTTTTNLTFTGSSATINFSGATGGQRQFSGGALSYGTLTLGANSLAAGGNPYQITGANTFGTLNVTGPANVQFPAAATTTITNAFTFAGTPGSPIQLFSANVLAASTLNLASGCTLSWGALQGLSISAGSLVAIDSFDLGGNVNSGGTITISPPSGLSPAPMVVRGGAQY